MALLSKFRPFLLWALMLSLQSCSMSYTATPIEAWVVDAKTNLPLEGVIVVAHWQLKGGLEGGNPVGQMMVMEAVTDASGRFYFPGWGPKQRPLNGVLKTQSPSLLLFKNGYAYRELENELSNKSLRGELDLPLRSDWHGKMIKMEKFHGGQEEYAKHLGVLSLSWAFAAQDCEWKKIPRIILASHELAMSFKKNGVVSSLYTINNLIPYEGYPDSCDARKYFKEHRP